MHIDRELDGIFQSETLFSHMSRFFPDPLPIICIPVLNRGDLLARCVQSIDIPVEKLLIINNGRDPSVADEIDRWMRTRMDMIGTVTVISPRRNIGVAPSWNIGLSHLLMEQLPYILFIGSDIQLAPGDLQKFKDAYDPEIALRRGNHDYSLFMVTQKSVRLAGFFDENLFPAYLEDCDYTYRLKLLELDCPDVEGVAAIHGDGNDTHSLTIRSDQELTRANNVTHARNFSYYLRKWGGHNLTEVFTSPFNDPNHWEGWWEHDLEHIQGNNVWPDR